MYNNAINVNIVNYTINKPVSVLLYDLNERLAKGLTASFLWILIIYISFKIVIFY